MSSFPFYKQLDAMDCGPTCLRMIAKWYGQTYSLQYLREHSYITRAGVSMLGISDAAESIGFRTTGLRMAWEQLEEVPLPFIVHWNKNHFVVVYAIKKKHNSIYKVMVADPANGSLVYCKEDFLKFWLSVENEEGAQGHVLALEPTPDFYEREAVKGAKLKIRYLLNYLRPYRKYFVQLTLGMLTGSIISLIFPFLTQSMVDYGIGNGDLPFIVLILIAQLLLSIGQTANSLIRSWIMLHITTRISIALISDFLIKLMKLPISFFDVKLTGDIMQRIEDHGRIQSFLTGTLLSMFFSALTFIVYTFIMASYHGGMLTVFMIGSVLYIGWVFLFLKRRRDLDYKDAIVLEKQLEKFPGVVHWDSIVRNQEMDGMLSLGELQNSYISFCKAWTNFRHYLEQNHLPMKINLLKQQILKQKEAYLELCQQKKLMLQDFNLASKQFQRDSTFYRKYNHAMSEVEYETHMQNYLQKKSSYISFSSSVKNVENNMLKLNENQIDLEIQYEKELNQFRLDMDETYQLLGEAYRQWKERYVITSTITGLITFTGYWSENQMVKSGERMATVVPQEDMQIIGRAVISMAGIGKVKKGQRVNIKLNGFPFMEYGMLRGEINNISLVPEKDVGYIAEIVLTGGMKSSYREQLSFIQEMDGVAEIITKEGRLLSRLINPFKSKLNE